MVCEMKLEGWWTDILHWIQGTKCCSKLFPNFLIQFSVLLNVYCRSWAGYIASTIIKVLWMCRIPLKLQGHTTTTSSSISFHVYDIVTIKLIISLEHNNKQHSSCMSIRVSVWLAYLLNGSSENRNKIQQKTYWNS